MAFLINKNRCFGHSTELTAETLLSPLRSATKTTFDFLHYSTKPYPSIQEMALKKLETPEV